MRNNITLVLGLSALSIIAASAAFPATAVPQPASIHQAAPAFEDEGPVPSSWKFDSAGRLLSVPGTLEVSYDADGHTLHVALHQQGVANDGSGDVIKLETVYSLTPAATEHEFDLREVVTRERKGELVVIYDQTKHGISNFVVEPVFHHVTESGEKVTISTADALKIEPSKILADIHIKGTGLQPESWIPLFCGAIYQAHIDF